MPHSPRSHPAFVPGEAEPFAQDEEQGPARLDEQAIRAPVDAQRDLCGLPRGDDRRLAGAWAREMAAAPMAPAPTALKNPRRVTPPVAWRSLALVSSTHRNLLCVRQERRSCEEVDLTEFYPRFVRLVPSRERGGGRWKIGS